MIQRVQSIFISLYLIIKLYLLYTSFAKINSFHFFVHDFDLFSLLLVLIIIFSIATLLSFKKRKTQIKLLYFFDDDSIDYYIFNSSFSITELAIH